MAIAKMRGNEWQLWSKVNRVSSLHLIHFLRRQPELSKTLGQAQIKAGRRKGKPPVPELFSVSAAVWESSLSRLGKEFSVFRQHSRTKSRDNCEFIKPYSNKFIYFLSYLPSHGDITFDHRPQRTIIHTPATLLFIHLLLLCFLFPPPFIPLWCRLCRHPFQAAGNGFSAGPDLAVDEPACRCPSGRSNGFREAC